MFPLVAKTTIIIGIFTLLANCASRPGSISAAYVSPSKYNAYSCSRLAEERARISQRAREVAGYQSSKATSDVIATTLGLVLFWPALFLLATTDNEAELANLKGDLEAAEQAFVQKGCYNPARYRDTPQAQGRDPSALQDRQVNPTTQRGNRNRGRWVDGGREPQLYKSPERQGQ